MDVEAQLGIKSPPSYDFNRRYGDSDIHMLATRVEQLDRDLQELRLKLESEVVLIKGDVTKFGEKLGAHQLYAEGGFTGISASLQTIESNMASVKVDLNEHITKEDQKYLLHEQSMRTLVAGFKLLRSDMVEPLSVYRAAKSGFNFAKWLTDTLKWVAPVIIGFLLATGFIHK